MTNVSLILAVFNEEKTIASCIHSVIAQSFSNWELIVIDDASTDQTGAILRTFKNDDRIKVFTNTDNLGLAASLNLAINQSTHDYLVRIDGDDIQLPNRLETQLSYLDKHPDVDILSNNINLISVNGNITKGLLQNYSHWQIIEKLRERNILFHPAIIFRRRFFKKAGYYDPGYRRSQDWELWLRGAESGCIFATSSEIVCNYCTNDYRRSTKILAQYTKARIRIFLKYQTLRQMNLLIKDLSGVLYHSLVKRTQ